MFRFLWFALLFGPALLPAQEVYLIGGYGGGLTKMPITDGIMTRYNNSNALISEYFQKVSNMGGPHAGVGVYAGALQFEAKYTRQGITRSATGFEQGVGVVGTDFRLSYHHINFALGIRPFDNNYLSLGASANLGSYRITFGRNGSQAEISRRFALGSDFFADLMIINKKPFMLKVRPFYRIFYSRAQLFPLESALNAPDPASVELSDFQENFNLFGMQFSLMYLLNI